MAGRVKSWCNNGMGRTRWNLWVKLHGGWNKNQTDMASLLSYQALFPKSTLNFRAFVIKMPLWKVYLTIFDGHITLYIIFG